MEKINVAELLKDCPKGMELDCAIFDTKVIYRGLDERAPALPICIRTGGRDYYLTRFGTWVPDENAKCVIFPKGKTTWEGFQRPFKDGDVVVNASNEKSNAFIYKGKNDYYYKMYVGLTTECLPALVNGSDTWVSIENVLRFATEEEKQKLFKAIKNSGHKWNPETKTLDELIAPEFKVGDRVKKKKAYISGVITDISDGTYRVEYKGGGIAFVNIEFQDDWELVSSKFDFTTLKPFESRVLVRDNSSEKWYPAIWGLKTDDISYPYIVVGGGQYNSCIPYESNEHLLGSTDDCDDFYKTWEQ